MKEIPLNTVIDECASTNDLAKRLGEEGAPHGSWISARRQSAGRGRQGRAWESHEGNLFLSIVLRERHPYPLTWVPLYVGYGAWHALRDFGLEDVALKWPNDLFFRSSRRKVGGILCEGVAQGSEQFIVAGIGLNCAHAPETTQPTAALGIEVDRIRDHVRESILRTISHPPTIDEFESALLIRPGEEIRYADDIHSTEVKTARFIGIGPSGELRVLTHEGERSHWSGEIRLSV